MLDDFEMNLGLVLCLRKARNFRLQESKRCRIVNFIWSTLLQISPNYVIIGTSHNAANFRLLHRPTRGCCLRVLFFFLLSLSSNPQVSVCRAQSQLVAHSAACAAPRSHCSLRTVGCFSKHPYPFASGPRSWNSNPPFLHIIIKSDRS